MIKKYLCEDIPEFFFKFDTGRPFDTCAFCDGLLSDHHQYAIEKVFKQNKTVNSAEIVYEYAICWGCATEAGQDISDDSRDAMMRLYQDHNDALSMKLDYLHRTEKYTIDSWLERCSLTGKEIRTCEEYTVSALIENNRLVFEHSPFVVSDVFMNKIQAVLSKETKDKFDGLRDKVLDGCPSIEDLIFTPTLI